MNELGLALELLTEARKNRQAKYGADDLVLLDLKKELAGLAALQGRLADSLDLHEELFKASLQILGPVHKDTIGVMAKLSDMYLEQGLWVKLENLNEGLSLSQESRNDIGPGRASTLGTTLLAAYKNQGKWADCVRVIEIMLQLAEEASEGKQRNPRCVFLAVQLASSLVRIGNLERSILESKGAIEEIGKMADDPYRLLALEMLPHLAIAYFNSGQRQACQDLLEGVVGLATRILGPDHQLTAASSKALGVVQQALSGRA